MSGRNGKPLPLTLTKEILGGLSFRVREAVGHALWIHRSQACRRQMSGRSGPERLILKAGEDAFYHARTVWLLLTLHAEKETDPEMHQELRTAAAEASDAADKVDHLFKCSLPAAVAGKFFGKAVR
jgi:hypothetical protein